MSWHWFFCFTLGFTVFDSEVDTTIILFFMTLKTWESKQDGGKKQEKQWLPWVYSIPLIVEQHILQCSDESNI